MLLSHFLKIYIKLYLLHQVHGETDQLGMVHVCIQECEMLYFNYLTRSPRKPLSSPLRPVTTDSHQVFGFDAPSPLVSVVHLSNGHEHTQPIGIKANHWFDNSSGYINTGHVTFTATTATTMTSPTNGIPFPQVNILCVVLV